MSVWLDMSPARLRRLGENTTPRRRWLAGLVVTYLLFYLLIPNDALRGSFLCSALNNLNVHEAEAWLMGRLHLDSDLETGRRPWDSAVFEGRVYNVFPPLFTLIALPVMAVGPPGVPSDLLILLLAAPLPALAFTLFARRTRRVSMAVLLSVCYLLGTSLLPVLTQALFEGTVYRVNHVLSQIGLLIFLIEYFGRRRAWVCGIGLIIGAWSRQLIVLYLIALAWLAFRRRGALSHRWRAASLVVVAVVMAALPMSLNYLKFGNPLDSGYRYIYEGRDDNLAKSADRGLFSAAFIPRNLYYMNVGLPMPELRGWGIRFLPNDQGTGIWWTTPLLLMLFADARRIWRRRALRALLVSAAAVYTALMLYHTTGFAQLGYNRFSLDFLLILLAAVAPSCDRQGRRWVTLGLVLWSVWYFRWAI